MIALNTERYYEQDNMVALYRFCRPLLGDRELRLLACAVAHQFNSNLRLTVCIETAADFADGKATKSQLVRARRKTRTDVHPGGLVHAGELVGYAIYSTGRINAPGVLNYVHWRTDSENFERTMDSLRSTIRHIVGNPFQPPSAVPVSATVNTLAQAVYDGNDEAIGPLHDSLVDVGAEQLAEHFDATYAAKNEKLRGTAGKHWRGCWALDHILGKGTRLPLQRKRKVRER